MIYLKIRVTTFKGTQMFTIIFWTKV